MSWAPTLTKQWAVVKTYFINDNIYLYKVEMSTRIYLIDNEITVVLVTKLSSSPHYKPGTDPISHYETPSPRNIA